MTRKWHPCGEMYAYTWSGTAWSGCLLSHKETSWWFPFFKSQEKHTHTLTSNHAYNFAQLSPIIHHIVHRSHRWISLFINICLLSRFGPGSLATAAPSNIFGFVLFTRESATWDRPPCYLPSLWTVPRLVAKDLFTRTTPSVLPSVQEYKTNYTHTSRNKYRIIIYRWLHCQS